MSEIAPKVSVICAWYNRADYLRDTINGLLAQDLDDYEIIVVNDGSTDLAVRETLDSYDDPRLRVFHRDNVGLVRTLRFAIEQSRGTYIAVQGAGDVSLPERLSKQYELLQGAPQLVAVGTWFENILLRADHSRVPVNKHIPSKTRFSQADVVQNNPLSHGEVMYRKDVYEKVGGYRPLFAKSQDRDLWLRMTDYGSIGMVPEMLYERRIFEESGIAASMAARTQQAAFAAFAVQCFEEKKRFGEDLLQEFGPHAALFRQPSAKLAKQLALFGIILALQGKLSRAKIYAALALREKTYPWSIFSSLFVGFMTSSAVPRSLRSSVAAYLVGRPAIKKRMQRFK